MNGHRMTDCGTAGWAAVTALLLTGLLPGTVTAQVGLTTDIITGVVVDAAGAPMADALVEATSLETEITRGARTDRNGRYTILFPDGGGQYRMTVRTIGYAPREGVLVRYADEDRLVWDAQMTTQAVMLDAVEVMGEVQRMPVRIADRPTPGSVELAFTPEQLDRLPIDLDDLSLLAMLVPGAVVLDPTDSTAAAYSVAGQRTDANAMTLDGMTFSGGSVPQEGMRSTRMVTSTYDVSRGGFSGGLVASTSRGGSNSLQSSWRYGFRDDALAVEAGDPSAFTSAFTQHQLSGGFGGPILRNRLFAYVSGQARLQQNPIAALTTATPVDLSRLGVAQDSLDRFIGIVGGLGARTMQVTETNRSNDNLSGMLRADYLLSQNHTVTVRGDWRGSAQEPTRISTRGLPESGGTSSNSGGGVMASVASRIGARVINEGRLYYTASDRDTDPYQELPGGRVQLASDLDGTLSLTSLSFGGASGMPSWSRDRSFEATDEISWLPGSARHRIKLGGSFRVQRSTSVQAGDQFGTYTFNSLADLEANQPSRFTRTLAPAERTSETSQAAAYAGSVTQFSRALQLTYGLRLETAWPGETPAYNPALDAALGVRTDRLPSEVSVSPRVGVTWTVGGGGMTPPAFIVQGGVGLFRSTTPTSLIARAQASTGLAGSETEINCIGTAVPLPDWNAFAADPGSIPDRCAGPSTPVSRGAPAAAVFAEDFASPKAWRASLGVQKFLSTFLRLSLSASYARGVSQYGYRDLNLKTSGGFRLASEGNRPVFVTPDRIVPATGAVSFLESRVDSSFAQVLEIHSGLQSDTKQLGLSIGGYTRTGVMLQVGYTWSHVRDQLSGAMGGGFGRGGFGTTAGDPNVQDWARSDNERRHSLVTTLGYPIHSSLEITAIGRISSGAPYTPMVETDINGDGYANDRAFVFDPSAPGTTTTVAGGMSQLLTGVSGSARDCLQSQVGMLAARNTCSGPWDESLELQLNFRPWFWGLGGRVFLSLNTMNLLRGVDQLVHGADGAHGWGIRQRPDATLLFVEGFDAASQSFVYAVNERFGATGTVANAQLQPFQVGLQVRVTLGPNRQQAAVDRLRGMGGGRGGFGGGMAGGPPGGMAGQGMGVRGGGITADNFMDRFRALLLNPAAVALDLRDTLALSAQQIEVLTEMADALDADADSTAARLQRQIEEAGGQDPQALMQLIRPAMEEARTNAQAAIDRLRAVLTEAQWGKMPEVIRNYGQRGPGVGRRPGE